MPEMLFCVLDATIHSLDYCRKSTKVQFAGITIVQQALRYHLMLVSGARNVHAQRHVHAPSADAGLYLMQSKTMSQGCHEQPPREQSLLSRMRLWLLKIYFFGYDDDACVFAESEDGTSDESVVSLIDTGDKGQPDGSVLE